MGIPWIVQIKCVSFYRFVLVEYHIFVNSFHSLVRESFINILPEWIRCRDIIYTLRPTVNRKRADNIVQYDIYRNNSARRGGISEANMVEGHITLALYDTGNSPNNPPLNLRGGLPKTESPPTHLNLVPGNTSVKHSIHPYASRTFRNGFHRPFA